MGGVTFRTCGEPRPGRYFGGGREEGLEIGALFRCCDEDKRGEKKGRKGRKRERRRGKGKGKGKEKGEEREREGKKEKGGRGGRGEGGKRADRDIRVFFLLGHNARFLYYS